MIIVEYFEVTLGQDHKQRTARLMALQLQQHQGQRPQIAPGPPTTFHQGPNIKKVAQRLMSQL